MHPCDSAHKRPLDNARIHGAKDDMFGLFRLAILLPTAFVLGLFFERSNATTACTDAGGTMRDGVCWNE